MLLNDDLEWEQCLKESSISLMPIQLRHLFSNILFFNKPANPLRLWNLQIQNYPFYTFLSEDFKRKRRNQQQQQQQLIHNDEEETTQDDINNCLYHLNDLIEKISGNTTNLEKLCPSLPKPTIPKNDNYNYGDNVINNNKAIYDQLPKNVEEIQKLKNLYNTNYEKANIDQKNVLDRINDAVNHRLEDNYQKLFFIDAPGGTGKTFVCNSIIAKYRSELKVVIAAATSGIASLLLLQPSKTIHSTFGIPLHITESSTSSLKNYSDTGKMLKMSTIIIIDEAPTIGKDVIEIVNKKLQTLMNNEYPFGNKIVILAGDFRQTLAIVKHGKKADIISNLIINTDWWSKCETLKLTINERLNQQRIHNNNNFLLTEQFNNFLLKIGKFDDSLKVFDEDNKELENIIQIPNDYIFQPLQNINDNNSNNIEDNHIDQLIKWCYPNIGNENSIENNDVLNNNISIKNTVIMTTLNSTSNHINNRAIDLMANNKELYVLKSADTTINPEEDAIQYTSEFLNSLDIPGMPPHELKLKIGAPVILLRNLDTTIGLANGTRMEVIKVSKYLLTLKIISGIFLYKLKFYNKYFKI